ncbi:GAF domain-containing protein [Actinocorallia lasiicapitis]
MAQVWASISDRAKADGEPVSLAHACLACADRIGAAGAVLTLSRDGQNEPVFTGDSRGAELADLQYTLGEGPSLDALADDRLVMIDDVAAVEAGARWPVFAPAATALGVRAMVALPIRIGAVRIGALELYRDRPGRFTAAETLDLLAYADALVVLVLDHRGEISPAAERFLDGEFVERRAGVHQAAGMVSVQLDVDVADAMARLRAYAYLNDRRLADVAAAVIERRLSFDPTTGEAQ